MRAQWASANGKPKSESVLGCRPNQGGRHVVIPAHGLSDFVGKRYVGRRNPKSAYTRPQPSFELRFGPGSNSKRNIGEDLYGQSWFGGSSRERPQEGAGEKNKSDDSSRHSQSHRVSG